MSQVAKSASAFVRAFLAILVLELGDMVVRWFVRPNSPAFMAIVGHAHLSCECPFAAVDRKLSGPVKPMRMTHSGPGRMSRLRCTIRTCSGCDCHLTTAVLPR